MTSHGGHYEIRIHILTNISRSIYNQTIKFDQLIINTRRNIFLQKNMEEESMRNDFQTLFKKNKIELIS